MKPHSFLHFSRLDVLRELPDALGERELRDWHGDVQDGGGDPPAVIAVHEPDEEALVVFTVDGTNHLGSGAIPGTEKKAKNIFTLKLY